MQTFIETIESRLFTTPSATDPFFHGRGNGSIHHFRCERAGQCLDHPARSVRGNASRENEFESNALGSDASRSMLRGVSRMLSDEVAPIMGRR